MLRSIFNPENGFFRFTDRVLDLVVLSLLWLPCCLPVVTIGPASAALYYSCAKCLRYKESGPYRSFLSAFRQNLRTGAATVAFLLLALVLAAGYAVLERLAPDVFRVMHLVLMLIPAVVSCAFPLLSRFTYTVGSLLSNSLRLTFRHLPRILATGILNTAGVVLTLSFWYCGVMLLTPALCAFLSTFLLEPVLRKYTPEEALEEGQEPPLVPALNTFEKNSSPRGSFLFSGQLPHQRSKRRSQPCVAGPGPQQSTVMALRTRRSMPRPMQAALAPKRSLVSLVPNMMMSRLTGSWLFRQGYR